MNPFAFLRRDKRKSVTKKLKRPVAKGKFESLERRDLMAGIPQLSSMPGASHTIFLDFDGHFQSSWRRTDSGQTYTNINVGEFNIDNTPGISDAESAAIRTIWETVADDYAPFDVNVTTIAPTNTANMLRVVMAGSTSAVLRTSAGTTMNIPTRDVFISNDDGTMVDTSGYSSVGSYTDAEPNVVFVFAKYMSTWGTVDSEGHSRDLRSIIATTASHEAGHSYGLEHHGDYDIGTNITTPIMGSNVQGDRSLWSSYYVGSTFVDSKARLASLLGSKPDDFGGTLGTSAYFSLSYSPLRGYSGTAKGVIGATNDVDMFRLNTSGTNTYRFTVTPPQFGNLDSQLVLYKVRGNLFGQEYLDQIIVVDPAIPTYSPFSGLGATIDLQLPTGNWAFAVRSHGGYGDVGTYALTVSIPSSAAVYYPVNGAMYAMAAEPAPSNPTPPKTSYDTNMVLMKSAGAGMGFDPAATRPPVNTPVSMLKEMEVERVRRKVKQDAADQVFAAW